MCGLSMLAKEAVVAKWELLKYPDVTTKKFAEELLKDEFIVKDLTKNLTKYLLRKLSMPI